MNPLTGKGDSADPAVMPDDVELVRFEDTRRLWRNPECRARLIGHWLDGRHPQKTAFQANRETIEAALSFHGSTHELAEKLKADNKSLVETARLTPVIIQSFFPSDGSVDTVLNQASVCHHDLDSDGKKKMTGFEAEAEILLHHHKDGHRRW